VPTLGHSRYQAVFLTNGSTYFGKLQDQGSDWFLLTDVFYLSTSDQSGTQLIKRGNEPQGPREPMIIPRDQILFIENMRDGLNRHDKLSPRMSSLIIANHVKEGLRLAEEYNLPRQIREIIPQHHGTRLIAYKGRHPKAELAALAKLDALGAGWQLEGVRELKVPGLRAERCLVTLLARDAPRGAPAVPPAG